MTLVSILGDFHSSILPVFYNFKEKLTHHIILHDDSKYDKKHSIKMLKAQKKFIDMYKDDKKINYKLIDITIDEDNYEDIIESYNAIIKLVKNPKDLYINSTDGLNSISFVLSNKIIDYGGNVIIYDRYANTYNLHSKNSMKKCHIKNNIDIKNHLKLKGYKLLDYTNKFELINRKEDILELTKDLVKYKKFANAYPHKVNSNMKRFKSIIENINIPEEDKVVFVKGTVFEEYIYWLIKDNLNFDEVMTAVSIEFAKDFKNEIDILMIKDNHLHSIECKFVRKLDGEHFVYKTDAIIDYLDDDGKSMILSIGNDKKELNPRKNKYSPQFTYGDLGRAENSNIKIHHYKELNENKFLDDVYQWFLDTN